MLKTLVVSLAVLMTAVPSFAADAISALTETEVSMPRPKPRTPEEEKKLAETRKKIEEKKTELDGSSWELVTSSSDAKAKGEQDTFTFQNGQFSGKNFSGRGFPATNYTVSIPSEDSETAVWETMQTGKEGLIFIRGEWGKDKMNGDITEQLDGGKKVREYSFTTAARKAIPPTSESGEQTPAGLSPSPQSSDDASSDGVLVSKESAPAVASFEPGTTHEVSYAKKKR